MGPLRPFSEQDIPQVAELHKRVFAESSTLSIPELQAQLRTIFLQSPWSDPQLPSLVHLDGAERVVGFLGVLPRPMSLKGRPVRAAISAQFMVDPASRGLPGLRLLKRFLDGPQDFSVTDGAGESTQKIWEALGGTASVLYSIHWTRPLGVSRYVASLASGRKTLAPLVSAMKPALVALDAVAARVPVNPFRPPPAAALEELTPETLLAALPRFTSSFVLRPDYDARSLRWVLDLAAQKQCWGRFRQTVVRDETGGVAGWHLYYVKPGAVAEVLQVAARPECMGLVLDRLFAQAWREGAIGVAGRLESRFFRALADKHCLFHAGGPRMLVHSRDQALLDALNRGDAFFSRLEGEWWMRFNLG